MKLKPIVASMALIASTGAFAGMYNVEAPVENNLERVLDRNMNQRVDTDSSKTLRTTGMIQANAFWSNVNQGAGMGQFGTTVSTSDIYLSRANLYFDADINAWVGAHVALTFANGLTTNMIGRGPVGSILGNNFLSDEAFYYQYNIVNEAYFDIRNFNETPVYFRGGIAFMPYGDYGDERNYQPSGLVQMLTESHGPLVQAGFVDTSGFNGHLWTARTRLRPAAATPNVNNFGASLGYCHDGGDWTFRGTVDYMYDIASGVNAFTPAAAGTAGGAVIGGIATTAKGKFLHDWDYKAAFTTALSTFAAAGAIAPGGRPMGWMARIGYSFDWAGMPSRVAGTYEQTVRATLVGTARGLVTGFPQLRGRGDFSIEVWKNTEFGLTYVWDRPYAIGAAGRPSASHTVLVSGTIKLA